MVGFEGVPVLVSRFARFVYGSCLRVLLRA